VNLYSKSNHAQWWYGDASSLTIGMEAIQTAIQKVGRTVYIIDRGGRECAVTHSGGAVCGDINHQADQRHPLIGMVPPLAPDSLGDPSFKADFGLRYAYIVGAMANGITSVDMVRAAGEFGIIGFFGSGGLSLNQVDEAIGRLQAGQERFAYGFNLIHSPNDPQLETAIVELYLKRKVRRVSASAYLGLTLPLVYYRIKGIHQTPDGHIVCPNRVIAKVSRVEVARHFFSPPPDTLLQQLVSQGKLNETEAQLARHVPMAQDMTAEADSGGHTDNRPAVTLLPTFLALRDECQAANKFPMPLRVGLAGGIATPAATAAAFTMGAAYVLTGSVNQSCIEADTSPAVRQMLVQARQADVTMAPAADMFELGAKVQVLKRGTMFAMRGAKLYELYRNYDAYDQIPEKIRLSIEKDLLRSTFGQAWEQTRHFFEERDPGQIQRAEQNPKHKMALVFRSYLGQASLWAKTGEPNRAIDYQIWCGPAMGAFNAWARGSFLEGAGQRRIDTIAMNLLYAAAVQIRYHWLQCQGVRLPHLSIRPLTVQDIEERMKA
jgi:trans-AT polyketide synthase/acyltransferase/oxidoreductase domain-containing protein